MIDLLFNLTKKYKKAIKMRNKSKVIPINVEEYYINGTSIPFPRIERRSICKLSKNKTPFI